MLLCLWNDIEHEFYTYYLSDPKALSIESGHLFLVNAPKTGHQILFGGAIHCWILLNPVALGWSLFL